MRRTNLIKRFFLYTFLIILFIIALILFYYLTFLPIVNTVSKFHIFPITVWMKINIISHTFNAENPKKLSSIWYFTRAFGKTYFMLLTEFANKINSLLEKLSKVIVHKKWSNFFLDWSRENTRNEINQMVYFLK